MREPEHQTGGPSVRKWVWMCVSGDPVGSRLLEQEGWGVLSEQEKALAKVGSGGL